MPSILMYLWNEDLSYLLQGLNDDPDIAFIVAKNNSKLMRDWIAIPTVDILTDGDYTLWHIPGTPLTIPADRWPRQHITIANPSVGWSEKHSAKNKLVVPWFGGNNPSTIQLEIRERGLGPTFQASNYIQPGQRTHDIIGMSSFGWIGNRYKAIGQPAAHTTSLWGQRLRRWVTQNSVPIPRWDAPDGPPADIYAFPCAYEAIQKGISRDANPL